MREFWLKAALSMLVGLAIKGAVALAGHSIAWWLAFAIAWIVVWGGWLIVTAGNRGRR